MVLGVPVLNGCAAVALIAASGSEKPGASLTQANYGAADMLSQQTQSVLNRDAILQIGMIADLAHPAAVTPFGQTVGNHIAARFVQLGYHVSAGTTSEMSGGAPPPQGLSGGYGASAYPDQQYQSPPFQAQQYPVQQYPAQPGTAPVRAAILTGQYAVAREGVLVNLRLLDRAGNRVIAAYDYTVPLTRDTTELVTLPGTKKGLFGF